MSESNFNEQPMHRRGRWESFEAFDRLIGSVLDECEIKPPEPAPGDVGAVIAVPTLS